jgi:hypothetical protein
MSKSNWTSKQVEAMMELANVGFSLEDASAAMINTGWEKRTVASLRSKYRSHTGTNWPITIDLELEDSVEEAIPTPMDIEHNKSKLGHVLILLVVVGIAVAYGWFY